MFSSRTRWESHDSDSSILTTRLSGIFRMEFIMDEASATCATGTCHSRIEEERMRSIEIANITQNRLLQPLDDVEFGAYV